MDIILTVLSALWLGILTSLSPCPLASNIAAVSFIAKKFVYPLAVLSSGVMYALGRAAAYVLVGSLIIGSFLSVPQTAQFLQKYMSPALGPVFIITGLILFFEFKLCVVKLKVSDNVLDKLVNAGFIGDFALGFVCALAFCPVSAAIFFGSLIPLALSSKTGFLLPVVYGAGTGLPVLLIALMIALGVKSIAAMREKINIVDVYLRKITAGVFILAGLYYCWIYFSPWR